jgi:hypothetical protein
MEKINLFIIGGQKTGSTSLFNYLKKHPKIISHEQRELTLFLNEFKDVTLLYKYILGLENKRADEVALGKSIMNFYCTETPNKRKVEREVS